MKPFLHFLTEHGIGICKRTIGYHHLHIVRQLLAGHHQGAGSAHGLTVQHNLRLEILLQYVIDPQHIVNPVRPAHADKVSLALSLAPHIRDDHMVPSLIVPTGKGIHCLFPACVTMEKQYPFMAFLFRIDLLRYKLISILSGPGQLLSVGVCRPRFRITPGFFVLLLDIIRMDQRFHTVLRNPGEGIQFLHGRGHQSCIYKKIRSCYVHKKQDNQSCHKHPFSCSFWFLYSFRSF